MIKRDLKTEVYAKLRSRVVNFTLLPGDRVSDKEIAAELNISRTPVREALIRLVGEGLLQSVPNRGFRVRVFTIKEIEDLYTLRESLEILAIRLATPRLDEIRIRGMRNLMLSYPRLIDAKDLAGFNKADEEFHHTIAQYSENALLEQTLSNLYGQVRIIRRYQHLSANSFTETVDDHGRIMEHMIRGEIEPAQQIMSDHIMGSMQHIVTFVRESVK